MLYFYEFPVQFHFTCRYTRDGRQLAGLRGSRGPQDAHSLSGDTSGLLRPRTAPGRGSRPREREREASHGAGATPTPSGLCVQLTDGWGAESVGGPTTSATFYPLQGLPRPPDRVTQPHDHRRTTADPLATSLDTRMRHTRERGRPGPPPGSSPDSESGGKGSKERTPGDAAHEGRAKDGAAPATPKSTGLREGPERRLPPGRPSPARRPATHAPPPSPSVVPPRRPPAAPAHLPLRLVGRGGRWNGEHGSHSPASRGVERQRRAAGGRHRLRGLTLQRGRGHSAFSHGRGQGLQGHK